MPFTLTHRPIENLNTISSEQGERIHPTQGHRHIHAGIDFAVPLNTSVKATHSGTVIKAGRARGIGRVVVLEDSTGMLTLYEHLNSYSVAKGDVITPGSEIGKSGDGSPDVDPPLDPHLHFEVLDGTSEFIDNGVDITVAGAIKKYGQGGSLGIPSSAPRLNPHPYLSDLVLKEAKSNLGLSDTPDNQLTPAQKKQIHDASCDIFNCDIDLTQRSQSSITLQGDSRNNRLTGNTKANEYIFPNINATGIDVIEDIDRDGALSFGGSAVTVSNHVKEIHDNSGVKLDNTWMLTHQGVEYYVTRVNEVDGQVVQDRSGTDLLLIPMNAADMRNSIRIKNYNFARDSFGLRFVDSELLMGRGADYDHSTVQLRDGGFLVIWNDQSINAGYIQKFDSRGHKVGDKITTSYISPLSPIEELDNGTVTNLMC